MADPTTTTTTPDESSDGGSRVKDILLRIMPFTAAMKRREDAQSQQMRERVNGVLLQEAIQNPDIYAAPEVQKSIRDTFGPRMGKEVGAILQSLSQRQMASRNAFSKLVEETGGNYDAAAQLARDRGIEVPKDVNELFARRAVGPDITKGETLARGSAELQNFLSRLPAEIAGEMAKALAKGQAETKVLAEREPALRPGKVATEAAVTGTREALQTDAAATREEVLRPGKVKTAAATSAATTTATEQAKEPFTVAREQRALGVQMLKQAMKAANDDKGVFEQIDAVTQGITRLKGAVGVMTDNPLAALTGLQWFGAQITKRDKANPAAAAKVGAIEAFGALSPVISRIFGDVGNIAQAEREEILRRVVPNFGPGGDTQLSALNKITFLEGMFQDIAAARAAKMDPNAIGDRIRARYQGFVTGTSSLGAPVSVDRPPAAGVPSPQSPPPPAPTIPGAPSPEPAAGPPPASQAAPGAPPAGVSPEQLDAARARLRAMGFPVP